MIIYIGLLKQDVHKSNFTKKSEVLYIGLIEHGVLKHVTSHTL